MNRLQLALALYSHSKQSQVHRLRYHMKGEVPDRALRRMILHHQGKEYKAYRSHNRNQLLFHHKHQRNPSLLNHHTRQRNLLLDMKQRRSLVTGSRKVQMFRRKFQHSHVPDRCQVERKSREMGNHK
jgi:hypothetical protein